MTVKRQPLPRWKYPRLEVLRKEVFASEEPPFGLFPSVTNIINANLCPVASYHDIIHGLDGGIIKNFKIKGLGQIYHDFISHLKFSIKKGDYSLKEDDRANLANLHQKFIEYSHTNHISQGEASESWRRFLEPWIQRKLEICLRKIDRSDDLQFEVRVANSHFRLPLGEGSRSYPLVGRIDEIDITNKLIIERTLKSEEGESVPLLKDYQLWLSWKLLCSLKKDQLPVSWHDVDFSEFKLIVETPERDYFITENPNFVEDTHSAYAWISDISLTNEPSFMKELFENAQCSPIKPHQNCGHPFINCFHTTYPFPRARPDVKQAFQSWYRVLLWEQMWQSHLWYYQTLMLAHNELSALGIIREGKINSYENGKIEISLDPAEVSAIKENYGYVAIPFGTLFCGLIVNAFPLKSDNNKITFQIRSSISTMSEDAILLLPPDSQTAISNEPPYFLNKGQQRGIFQLTHIGSEKEEIASKRSQIQLLEALYGTKKLRREKNEH